VILCCCGIFCFVDMVWWGGGASVERGKLNCVKLIGEKFAKIENAVCSAVEYRALHCL